MEATLDVEAVRNLQANPSPSQIIKSRRVLWADCLVGMQEHKIIADFFLEH
jgi:hypothetical protein